MSYRSLRNQKTVSLRRDLVEYRKKKLSSQSNSPGDIWSSVKQILNWENSGPPVNLFSEGRMLAKPAVAGAINRFFIKKGKDIINNIPHIDMDPLSKLKEWQIGGAVIYFNPQVKRKYLKS